MHKRLALVVTFFNRDIEILKMHHDIWKSQTYPFNYILVNCNEEKIDLPSTTVIHKPQKDIFNKCVAFNIGARHAIDNGAEYVFYSDMDFTPSSVNFFKVCMDIVSESVVLKFKTGHSVFKEPSYSNTVTLCVLIAFLI